MMGALGGGLGSFMQNREQTDSSGDSTGTGKSGLSTNQKLLFSGADMLSKDPQAEQQAYIDKMLATLPKPKTPGQGSGKYTPPQRKLVGRI